jgi:hypothetical protein
VSLALLISWLFLSIGEALVAPGTDSVSARLAEWARQHHLGGLVTKAEQIQYRLHPPRTGGSPNGGIPKTTSGSGSGAGAQVLPQLVPAPAALRPLAAGAALPGEGIWQSLDTVHGLPALRATYLRPDSAHTSYLTGVAWMDQRLVTFTLHPGTSQPGGSGWHVPSLIAPQETSGLIAAFNSGFTLADSRGGYFAEQRTVARLIAGRASLVVRKDGTATVGQWGRDVRMSADVASVRQNLDLIVDHGRPVSYLNDNTGDRWGRTVGNAYYVWRSGIGITASGQLIYAAGDALSAESLARVLADAGAVRAMQLDINRDWTSFDYYHVQNGVVTARKLTSDEFRPARRYLSTSSRDFYTVYARP